MSHTCGGCPARWTGLAAAHCAACHETFSTVGNFDRHRRGGECLLPASCGLIEARNRAGVWMMPPAGLNALDSLPYGVLVPA